MEENKQKSESALREEAILRFWKENQIFSKTLSQSKGKKEYVFYEGPPTANGKPGIHHLEARAFKDVIPRYKTMRGYHVRRKGGWDTHGLPVELEVEKRLDLKSKKEIEDYGIAKFNQECKKSVWTYVDLWEKFTERIGFWVDQKNPYVTYHNEYIESVWNVIKEANKQKLLYKDYKVVPWCPRCGTALSSHELAQGYETVKDLSVYVKFKLKNPPKLKNPAVPPASGVPHGRDFQASAYVLAWTTTPWTLPGNVALAVGENIDYVKIVAKTSPDDLYILAKERLSVIEGEYEILEEMKGRDLVGLEYEPLYPFLKENIKGEEKKKLDKAYQIYPASFVTTEDGTGVVHTAVMYGQDDFVLGNEIGLPKHHLVGLDGKFLAGTGFLEGRPVRPARNASGIADAGGDEEVAVDIIKDLAGRGLLLKKEKYEHSYPHCWRCHTALIYYARDSWYIRMSSLRDELVKGNEGINWEPAHIKEGRFGEWLREIKDWAISRERYWGTPLPVWTCEKCHEHEVVGSIADIKRLAKKSGNKYFVMRHGEAESNVQNIISSKVDAQIHLTEKGKEQVKNSIANYKNTQFDLIFASPFLRTRETAEIIKKELEFKEDVVYDDRLVEINFGDYEGKGISEETERTHLGGVERYYKKFPGGESHEDVKRRMGSFLYELESKYKNKNIIFVTHGDPFWLASSFTDCASVEETVLSKERYPEKAEIRELNFVPLPHNENYELDLHKPYIDEIELVCTHSTSSGQACGGKLERTKEVMDVWLDSGAMPFAQDHYPFDGEIKYPADFISEAIDQTRGWFYTLHAVGTIMGRGRAYKNVICLGHLLDAKGKKMSKSLGNIVDPWKMMDKYGADTLRLWMYAVNQPGDSKNFDEKTVLDFHRQVFGLLYNVLAFYELYRDPQLGILEHKESNNILDQWIVARLNELNKLCVEKLDAYKVLEPTRAIRDFVGDLSTWYLRRSRERIKAGDPEARQTLYFVLKNLAKIMAPFTPLAAEDIWQKLKNEKDAESVHLTAWPEIEENLFGKILKKILHKEQFVLGAMERVREIVTLGLQARQKAGIPVRQPLSKLKVKNYELQNEYSEIIKDELNVKEIYIDANLTEEVTLDLGITPDLKAEGQYREFVRSVQDLRKKAGMTPSDMISLLIEADAVGKELIQKFENEIKKTVLAGKITLEANNGETIKIGELSFKIKIEK